jgi:Transglycosylase-like domain
MRHRAARRHGRYHEPRPLRAFLISALAVLIAALTVMGLSGDLTASAAPQTPAARPVTAVTTGTAVSLGKLTAQLRARVAQAAQVHAATLLAAATYTVRAGDSISSVAAKACGTARDWTGIYTASRAHGWTARNANDLTAGQHLFLSCAYVASAVKFAPLPPPKVTVTDVVRHTTSSGGRVYHRSYTTTSTARSATYHGSGSMQSCIISRESGGNSQVMNSSGHYGLYQFSESTWEAHGGSAANFGHASVAEQNAVYEAAVAEDGYSDWAPYDGC